MCENLTIIWNMWKCVISQSASISWQSVDTYLEILFIAAGIFYASKFTKTLIVSLPVWLNPNPLPWNHFCQNDFIFLFQGWNKCQKKLGKFDFHFFNI